MLVGLHWLPFFMMINKMHDLCIQEQYNWILFIFFGNFINWFQDTIYLCFPNIIRRERKRELENFVGCINIELCVYFSLSLHQNRHYLVPKISFKPHSLPTPNSPSPISTSSNLFYICHTYFPFEIETF